MIKMNKTRFFEDIDHRQQKMPSFVPCFQRFDAQCSACPELVKSRQRIVWGWGKTSSKIMFIGQAPGLYTHSAVTGLPLTGNLSGMKFQEMLKKAGFEYDDVYTTNVVKCHPPGNRPPNNNEITKCQKYLMRELAIVKPKIVVALGRTAMKFFLPEDRSILNEWRKGVRDYDWTEIPARFKLMILPHPAFIVRQGFDGEYLKSFNELRSEVDKL
jgi:uracil-DNA glycosylase family 4